MSLPTVSVPVAVLVLTWDETTPAVRALVEATEIAEPLLDSIVVLVPAGPATDELTKEEFLPLEVSFAPEATPPSVPAQQEPLPAPTALAPAAEATETIPAPAVITKSVSPLAVTPTQEAVLPTAVATSAVAASPLPALIGYQPTALTAPLLAPGLAGQESFAVPGGPAVRVLRLSDYSLAALAAYSHQALPAPTWVGTAAVPAAPYLGSLAAVAAYLPLGSGVLSASPLAPVAAAFLGAKPVLTAKAAVAQQAVPMSATTAAVPSHSDTKQPIARDAEAAATLAPAFEEAPPVILDAEESITELSEPAADELVAPFAVDVTPVQAGWPNALASLQTPAAFAEAEKPTAPASELVAEAPTERDPRPAEVPAAYAALLPTAQRFDAPNLNFQIIQYARFAVPLALATQPFGVIYAPAWPTWLAAQELRQRTGRPLVLHIATLAAQDEPLALAAGWPAEIQRQALHRADLILTETPALAYRLRRELDLPAHRVRPVPAADAAAVAQALSTAQAW